MNSQAAKVLQKLRTSFEMTSAERQVLEVALRRFEGLALIWEAKRAFLAGDFKWPRIGYELPQRAPQH